MRDKTNVNIEWLTGVVRVYQNNGSFENKDPYSFSATIRGVEGVAEILGVSHTPSISIAKGIASELKKQGFHTMMWYRYKNGFKKKIIFNLTKKEKQCCQQDTNPI